MTGKSLKLKHLQHKFHAKPTTYNGLRFDSRKEANYYLLLKSLVTDGSLLFFLRQVPFDLPGNIKYRLDFMEFWTNGDIIFREIKGMITPISKLKIAQVEELYPITITIN